MPGVPSSRGCNPCRKQKKKCHATGPICQRCQRLQIPCDGLGQVKYMFKEQTAQFTTPSKGSKSAANATVTRTTTTPLQLERPLSNEVTRLQSAFIANTSPTINIKHSLLWNFGIFLADIPRRLGCNAALDAATTCLLAAYEPYCAGQHQATYATLLKYTRALQVLRQCLLDPTIAHTSETLCSVMVIMMAQSLLDTRSSLTASHATGASQLLKSRGQYGPRSDFEKRLFLSLRGPVVLSAVITVEVDFTQQQWKDLVESNLDDGTPEGAMMSCLAKIPNLIRRGRNAKTNLNPDSRNLESIKDDVQSLDATFAATLETLRNRLRTRAVTPISKIIANVFGSEAVHSLYLRMYALGLATEILIVSLRFALEADSTIFGERLERASHEMIALADEAAQWLPLGAMSMHPCIAIAWIGARDVNTRQALQARWFSYERIIGHASMPSEGTQSLERLQQRLALESA